MELVSDDHIGGTTTTTLVETEVEATDSYSNLCQDSQTWRDLLTLLPSSPNVYPRSLGRSKRRLTPEELDRFRAHYLSGFTIRRWPNSTASTETPR